MDIAENTVNKNNKSMSSQKLFKGSDQKCKTQRY